MIKYRIALAVQDSYSLLQLDAYRFVKHHFFFGAIFCNCSRKGIIKLEPTSLLNEEVTKVGFQAVAI